MTTKVYILAGILAAILIGSCEKEEIPCLKKIKHYTSVPGEDYNLVLIYYSEEVPKDTIRNNVLHRFEVLQDCSNN